MARRYGRLPTDILDLTIEQFSLNEIVMEMGARYEKSVMDGRAMVLSSGMDNRVEISNKIADFFEARKKQGNKSPSRLRRR